MITPSRSSTYPASSIVITILLATFPLLYLTSPWLFCNCRFALLDPFTFFTHATHPFSSDSHQFLLCICDFVLFVHVFCSLDSRVIEIIWYLFLSVWLISLSTMPARSIHVVADGKLILSYGQVIFHFLYAAHIFI